MQQTLGLPSHMLLLLQLHSDPTKEKEKRKPKRRQKARSESKNNCEAR
jgi:hypothetical protein